MKYRRAYITDYDKIIQIRDEAKARIIKEKLPIWLNGYPLDEMIREDILLGDGRVLEEENKIIGYACFHKSEKEYPSNTFLKENLYSFGRLMIRNDSLGKHYGSSLVKHLVEEARGLEADGVGILVDDCNQRALQLYKHYGFLKEGRGNFPWGVLDIYTLYF